MWYYYSMNINYKQLTDELISHFGEYHNLLDVPINGLIWENLLYNSLINQSNNVIWKSGSHQTGTDIQFEGIGISCKGGRLKGNKKDKFKVSSYRSTSYKTLEEKINFFSEKHEDVYFCLSYEDAKTKHEYRLFTFDADILDYRSLNWKETKSGWKGVGIFQAEIRKKMSDQLWLQLPVHLLTEQFHITIEKGNKYDTISNVDVEKLSATATLDSYLVGEHYGIK